jgi:signal transduction histidine kinase
VDELSVASQANAMLNVNLPVGVTSDPGVPGFVIGGESSGTIAFVVEAAPGTLHPAGGARVSGVGVGLQPDPGLVAAALESSPVIRETTIGDAPVRVLAATVESGGNRLVAIVIGDRTAEVDTLRSLLAVLLGGGSPCLRPRSPSATCTRAGPWSRSASRCAASGSSRPTPATSSDAAGHHSGGDRRGAPRPRRPGGGRSRPDDLDAGATRLELLVDDLLLLARTDADAVVLETEDTDLALAAAEAAEALEAVAAEHGVRLAVDVADALRGDEAHAPAGRDPVANAVGHAAPGGQVRDSPAGGGLVVEDDGPGSRPSMLTSSSSGSGAHSRRPADWPRARDRCWIAERTAARLRPATGRPARARFVVRLPGA